MSLLNWFLNRPEPEFAQEQVVRVDDSQDRFMLIRSRRWARPNHAKEKCWVYDGPVFSIVDGEYVLVTYGYYIREEALVPIRDASSLIELV